MFPIVFIKTTKIRMYVSCKFTINNDYRISVKKKTKSSSLQDPDDDIFTVFPLAQRLHSKGDEINKSNKYSSEENIMIKEQL